MLARARVRTSKLLRTGGIAAMSYGESITWVSNRMLRAQRGTAAKARALAAGSCGQDLDLALVMADNSARGRPDPAYEAHCLPPATWTLAIWEQWLPPAMIDDLFRAAMCTIATAKCVWTAVNGPAAAAAAAVAVAATAARIGWNVAASGVFVTDTGTVLNLRVDPPKVGASHVFDSVRRWRWKRIAARTPRLAMDGVGDGACMEPLWKLLHSKRQDDGWNDGHNARFRSAFANRQWTQSRCHSAKLVAHNKCLLCLDDLMMKHHPGLSSDERAARVPSQAIVDEASVGNSFHRITACPRIRKCWTITRLNVEHIFANFPIALGDCCIKHALFPAGVDERYKLGNEGIHWIVRAQGGIVKGTVHHDGSWLDGPGP